MTSHHEKPTVMRLRLPNSDLATTNAKNASVMGPHLAKVYQAHRPVDFSVLRDLLQRPTILELDAPIPCAELKRTVRKLANRKFPGLNDVPPDAIKALDDTNLLTLLDFFNSYWDKEIGFSKWHGGQIVLVPKSGDLSDLNKWRVITLIDLGSKIFSSILCTRLFVIIRTHGVKYQFDSTPSVGCQDESFTIKTMLNLRHNHNLPKFVMFANLVKAFDTFNRKLMVQILGKYECPPKLCSAIHRMYTDNKVRLLLGDTDLSILFEVGVKQGDSVAPVLFLFIIIAFAETLEKEWVKHDLHMIQFKRRSNSHHSAGRITSHLAKTFSHGTFFEIFCMFYVNDGAFAFATWWEFEIGAYLVFTHFARFGLQMHIRSSSKPSKTECVFFPTPSHFKLSVLPSPTPPPDPSSSLPIVSKPKQESEEARQKRHDKQYDETEETKQIPIGELGFFTIMRHFKYNGGYISYSLQDDYNVEVRISQVSTATGTLNPFWRNDAVDDFSKCLIFCAIPYNLLLWGCESWALQEATLKKLKTFLHPQKYAEDPQNHHS